jgi:hypothetical protein
MTFILGCIAYVMRLGQHPPDPGRLTQRVRQSLKCQITILRPVTMPAQCGQRQGMGGAIGKIETAGQGELLVAGVSQAFLRGSNQAIDFPLTAGLYCQLPDGRQICERFIGISQYQPPCRSKTV